MVRTMNIWTDDTPEAQKARELRYLHSAIIGAEKNGALFPKKAYTVAGLTPPTNSNSHHSGGASSTSGAPSGEEQ